MKLVTKDTEQYFFDREASGFDGFFTRIAQYPLLSYEQEQDLALRIAGGDEGAFQTLVEHNLRLVVYVAKRYMRPGVSLEDVVQEGMIGLMRAARKYNGKNRFSTYATWWIMQTATRNIDVSYGSLYIPVHALEARRTMRRVESQHEASTGEKPSIEELASLLKKSIEEIAFLQSLDFQVYSLENSTIADEPDGPTYRDTIIDHGAVDPYDTTDQIEAEMLITDVLDHLSERESDIIRRRYGIAPYPKQQTLREIADELLVTRERVRQLENKAMVTLRQLLLARREYAA